MERIAPRHMPSKKNVMTKRGKLLTRIIMISISVLVVSYMVVQIQSALYEPVRTVLATLYTAEESDTANGIFIRKEIPIEKQGEVYELLVDDGEKVSLNQQIAAVFSDTSALVRANQIRSLDSRIAQLQYARNTSSDMLDASRQNDQIYSMMVSILSKNSRSDFSHLSSDSLALKSLILRREFAFGGNSALDSQLASLVSERSALSSAASSESRVISAPQSGTFCATVDGLEATLLPEAIDTLTPSTVATLLRDNKSINDNKWLGKIITSFDWYFVAVMPSDIAAKLSENQYISIRFSPAFDSDVPVRVKSITTDENNSSMVVFSSSVKMTNTMSLRREKAEIIFKQHEGVRIPREAIRIDEDGTKGVYCTLGMSVTFKPVNIDFERDNYYICSYTPDEKNSIRPGDEVVVAGKDLYNGKIIK